MIFEIEVQDMLFDSIKSTQSNLVSEMLTINLEDKFEDILESSEELKNILELSEEPEIIKEFKDPKFETCLKFSNDVYKDLILLVTKYKLNNKASNDIIRFFNKHSNLTKSPLPKNIEKGRALMDNMKFSNLEFCKVFIINHGGKDYYLYHQNLIQCIKNILSVP